MKLRHNYIQETFTSRKYENIYGFAGSGTTNRLYCWPCLPFCNKHEVWNKQGISNLNDFSSAQQKNSKPETRVNCYLQLKLFGK
jgi:hypothetical protein